MALIKLAAASAAAYGLYRLITRQNETSAQGLRPAPAGLTGGLVGGPTTSPQTPVGQGGNYVPPT